MGHAVIDLALIDEDAPLGLQRLCFEVARSQSLSEIQRRRGEPAGTVEVAGAMGHLRLAQEQVSIGDALGVAVEGAPGPPKPAAGGGRSGADGVVFPEPHCALPCLPPVVLVVKDPVHGFPSSDAFIEPAEPPRCLGFRVESVGLQARGVHAGTTGGVQRCLPVVAAQRVVDGLQRVAAGFTIASPRSCDDAIQRLEGERRTVGRVQQDWASRAPT